MNKYLSIILTAALFTINAYAWEPIKPITVIVGNAPGAGNEIAFRKLSSIVQKANPRVVFVIQNMPGADSVISMNHFLTVPNDGSVIALPAHMSTYVTNDIWESNVKKFNYDSFTDVLTMGKSPLVLIASPLSKINTPEEFSKIINTTTTPINIALGGGAHRAALEYLMSKNNGNSNLVKPIKFNGAAPAIQSVVQFSGKDGTEFGILPISVAKGLIDGGKVKPIGFTGTKLMPQYPMVPLLQGIAPGINVYAAWSITLPPKTDPEIVEWYRREFSAAILSQEYIDWTESQNIFIPMDELTPAGLKRNMNELRSSFLPLLKKIDLSKE